MFSPNFLKAFNLIIFTFIVVGCQQPEDSLEMCNGDKCIPTNTGPGDANGGSNSEINSTSGILSLKSYDNITLDNEFTLYDVREKDQIYYFYIQNKVSQSIIKYEIYKVNLNFTSLDLVCSFLSDNNFGKTFNFVGNDFLIESSSYTLSFRKFNSQTCNEKVPISTGIYKGYHSQYSIAGTYSDSLYFLFTGDLAAFDLNQSLMTDQIESLSLGSLTSQFYSASSISLSGNTLWAVIGQNLWKYNVASATMGWAKLPTNSYKSLQDVTSISASEGKLIIFAEGTQDSIDVLEFDTSKF